MQSDVQRDLYHRGGGAVGLVPGRLLIVPHVASLPTASARYRDCLAIVRGGTGVADTLRWCRKGTADTYSWVTVTVS